MHFVDSRTKLLLEVGPSVYKLRVIITLQRPLPEKVHQAFFNPDIIETNAHFYVRPNATGDRYDDPRRWFIPSFFSPWLVWQALLMALANSTKEREGPLNTSGGGRISKPPGLLQLIAQRRVSESSALSYLMWASSPD